MKNKLFIAGAAALLTLAAFTSSDTIPSVKVKDMDGNSVDFSSVADSGVITVVSFWATWCGPCLTELKAIDEHYADWKDKYKMKLVAVSIDDARNSKKVKPKVIGNNWTYEIYIDENQDLARAMGVNMPPMTFVYDRQGKLFYSHQGYTPGAEDELEKQLIAIDAKK